MKRCEASGAAVPASDEYDKGSYNEGHLLDGEG